MNTGTNLRRTPAAARKIDDTRQKLYRLFASLFREELDSESLADVLALQPEIETLASAAGEAQFSLGSRLLKE